MYAIRSYYVDGPIGDDMLLSLEDKNMIGLCWLDSGARNFYNTKRPIKSLSDLKGLKIRVQESELIVITSYSIHYTKLYDKMYNGLKKCKEL